MHLNAHCKSNRDRNDRSFLLTTFELNFKEYAEHQYFGPGERGLTFSLSAEGRLKESVTLGGSEISPVISTSIKIEPKAEVPDGKKVFHLYCPGHVQHKTDDSTVPFYLTNIGDTQIISPGMSFLSKNSWGYAFLDLIPLTSDMKPPHDFVYSQMFNFAGPNESQQVIATSNWYVSFLVLCFAFKYFSSFGLTEAIAKEDLLKSRTAATKTLIIRSQDDSNIQTELHQHAVSDDSNDDTTDDQSLDPTDQTPTDSSDDDTNQNPSDDDTSSGTDHGDSDEGTSQSSSETADSGNQIELPEQLELTDTTIGSIFDGSNSPYKITVYCYIDGVLVDEPRLEFDDVKLTSREYFIIFTIHNLHIIQHRQF